MLTHFQSENLKPSDHFGVPRCRCLNNIKMYTADQVINIRDASKWFRMCHGQFFGRRPSSKHKMPERFGRYTTSELSVCVCVCLCEHASESERICTLRKYTLHHAVNKSITANLKCTKFATERFH